jgi:hypothetical protein
MVEEVALRTVMAKLEALGSRLPFPHQSAVRVPQSESSDHARDVVPGGGFIDAQEQSTSS